MPPPDSPQSTPISIFLKSSSESSNTGPHPIRSSSQLLPTTPEWLWFLGNVLLLYPWKFNNGNSDPALFPVLLYWSFTDSKIDVLGSNP